MSQYLLSQNQRPSPPPPPVRTSFLTVFPYGVRFPVTLPLPAVLSLPSPLIITPRPLLPLPLRL